MRKDGQTSEPSPENRKCASENFDVVSWAFGLFFGRALAPRSREGKLPLLCCRWLYKCKNAHAGATPSRSGVGW